MTITSRSGFIMSNLGEEYRTEFGEFLDFETDARDHTEPHEPFQEWVPLSDVDLTRSPIFQAVADAVAAARTLQQKK
jgi:hypothetical protein